MKKSYLFFFFLVIVFLNFSCKKPDITPAYLLLSEEDFQNCINTDNFNKLHETDYNKEELNVIKQQNFTEVLISLRGQSLGYWHLPCRIPLLPDYSQKNNIQVIPCVRTFNTSSTATPYYFLSPVEQFFDMEKEGEYKLSDLKFEYVQSIAFPVLETFSQSTVFKPRNDTIDPVSMEVHSGEGRIVLTDSVDFFNVVTPYFYLRGQGMRQFWEMEYKCETGEMVAYLEFQNTITGIHNQDMIVFPATTNWKKAYIDLTDVVSWACGTASRVSVRLGIKGYPAVNAQNATFRFKYVKVITMSAPY